MADCVTSLHGEVQCSHCSQEFLSGRADDGMESADKIELLEEKITIMVQTSTANHECKI